MDCNTTRSEAMKAPEQGFKSLPDTNPRPETASWRVTGTRRTGGRIRENFADAAEALRYLIATKAREVRQRKLSGV